jgi:hypothetical protein
MEGQQGKAGNKKRPAMPNEMDRIAQRKWLKRVMVEVKGESDGML